MVKRRHFLKKAGIGNRTGKNDNEHTDPLRASAKIIMKIDLDK